MPYPLANALYQWEEGARELAAIEDPRHRRLADRVISAIRLELRRRIGPTFTAEELADLYGEGTDWAQQIAIDVAPAAGGRRAEPGRRRLLGLPARRRRTSPAAAPSPEGGGRWRAGRARRPG